MAGPRKKTSKNKCRVTVSYDTVNELGDKVTKLKYIERKTWALAESAADKFRETLGKPVAPKIGTLSEAFALVDAHVWADPAQVGADRRATYNTYRRMIEAKLGHRPVDEITSPEITRYAAPLKGQVSQATISEHFKALGSVYRYIVSDLGWIKAEANPVPGARRPKGKVMEKRPPLVRAVFDEVLPHLDPAHRFLAELMAETALRPDEAIKATSAQVIWRFDRYWIDVQESKTHNGIRLAPLSPEMAERMQSAGDPFAHFRTLKDPTNRTGIVWKRAFAAMNSEREARGLETIPFSNHYKIRAMRLTEWARAKMDRYLLRIIAGHSDVSVTDTFYIDLGAEEAAEALTTLGV